MSIFFSDNLWYGQTFNIKNKGNNKKTHLVSDICHITYDFLKGNVVDY
jgi:hypothetical protein